ncbi:hypothetical protein PAXRUDRAFT_836031, partial [Paxillus rubicundulus Ve08.2h10]
MTRPVGHCQCLRACDFVPLHCDVNDCSVTVVTVETCEKDYDCQLVLEKLRCGTFLRVCDTMKFIVFTTLNLLSVVLARPSLIHHDRASSSFQLQNGIDAINL